MVYFIIIYTVISSYYVNVFSYMPTILRIRKTPSVIVSNEQVFMATLEIILNIYLSKYLVKKVI